MSAASTMTRTSGSVPDWRSRTRPVSPSSRSASTTAAASSAEVFTRVLSTSGTLMRTCGMRCMTPASSVRLRPVAATRAASIRPVSVPSPVVAWSRTMTCPDCSPPSAKPSAFIDSRTYRSPTAVWTSRIPSRSMASLKPRFDITVPTTVSLRS